MPFASSFQMRQENQFLEGITWAQVAVEVCLPRQALTSSRTSFAVVLESTMPLQLMRLPRRTLLKSPTVRRLTRPTIKMRPKMLQLMLDPMTRSLMRSSMNMTTSRRMTRQSLKPLPRCSSTSSRNALVESQKEKDMAEESTSTSRALESSLLTRKPRRPDVKPSSFSKV